ncbi:MAG TPA: hypothetical protein VK066_31390 [Chloroflexota bacterium]|nr:hypothetical protein [Chloroflexota bacterium]
MHTGNGPAGTPPAEEQRSLQADDRREWRLFLVVLVGVLATPILATALAALVAFVMWHTTTILPDQAPPTPTSQLAPQVSPSAPQPG